jgi:hypothetical protein
MRYRVAMDVTESRTAQADPGSRDHARVVLRGHEGLRSVLGKELAGDGPLSVLLFLYAESEGAGISTAACCAASAAPRTTALRWITALAGGGWVVQVPDRQDRRVTLLQLAPHARDAVYRWLLGLAGVR